MNNKKHTRAPTWALVLAAGEGSRLRSLTTTPNGLAVPKQFCSLHGGPSLLNEALLRAAAVAPPERTCAIVAAQHARWWPTPLRGLPNANVVVQPENRGTAHGILLPLLHIAAMDPDATVVLLPADHHVRDEAALAISLRHAAALAAAEPDGIFLLGVEPETPDGELGYIVPGETRGTGSAHVVRFVEKPDSAQARALIGRGALWNVFIIAATVHGLLTLFGRRLPAAAAAMRALIQRNPRGVLDAAAATELYRSLPSVDFSRDVLEGEEASLRVLPVPRCGWTDLGTPQRVAETLQRLDLQNHSPMRAATSYLSLAAAHARQQFARPSALLQGAAQ